MKQLNLKYKTHIVPLNPPNDIDVIGVMSNKLERTNELKTLHAWALDEINDIFGSDCNYITSTIENETVLFEATYREKSFMPSIDYSDYDEDVEDTPNIAFQIHCMDHLEKNGKIRKNLFLSKKKQEGVRLYILAYKCYDLSNINGYMILEIFPELRNYEIEVDSDGCLVHKGNKSAEEVVFIFNSNGYKIID